jgi:predicted Zn-dependent protease
LLRFKKYNKKRSKEEKRYAPVMYNFVTAIVNTYQKECSYAMVDITLYLRKAIFERKVSFAAAIVEMKGNFATATYYRNEKEIEGTLLQSLR